jgi:hypothetical protein
MEITPEKSTRYGRDVASRMVAARLVAALYFVAPTLLFRLPQIAFTQEQLIATLGAKTIKFAINNVFAHRGRRFLGSRWWRGWLTLTVVATQRDC